MKKIILVLMMLIGITSSASAELRVSLTEGVFKPIPVAIPVFAGEGGQEITQVIVNDLESCGLFKLVDPAAYIQSSQDVMSTPPLCRLAHFTRRSPRGRTCPLSRRGRPSRLSPL